MTSLAELQADRDAQTKNLSEIEEILAVMPDSAEALEMKDQVLASIREIEIKIALLNQSDTASPAPVAPTASVSPPTAPTTAPVSGKPENHDTTETRVFKVNENVSARYAADRQYYPATVVSVMGSASAPIYTVKFKGYTGTETVRAHEIRPILSAASASQKRKADGTRAASNPTPVAQPPVPVNSGSVLSAPSAVDMTAMAVARNKERAEQAKSLDDQPDKPKKKVKTNKALDKAKNNWQSWQQKSSTGKIAKVANKESMFRTGENPAAKVGFTGSGNTMRKDADRTRHVYYESNDPI